MAGHVAEHVAGTTIANQKGAVLIIFALLLLVLILDSRPWRWKRGAGT